MNARRRHKAKARRRVIWLMQTMWAIYDQSGAPQARAWMARHQGVHLTPWRY